MRHHPRCALRALISSALLIPTAGCGDDVPAGPPPPRLEYELFETTKELDADTLAALASIAPDRTSVTFSRSTPLLDALAPNDVLLSGATDATPEGLLVQVVSIDRSGATVSIEAVPATVFHAFRRMDLRIERLVLPDGPVEQPPLPPRPPAAAIGSAAAALTLPIPLLGDPDFDEEVFEGDGLASTTEDRVDARGKMLEQVTVKFWLSFDWEDLSPTAAFSALNDLLDSLEDLFSGSPPDLGDVLHLDTGLRIDGDVDVLLEVIGSSSLHFDEEKRLSWFELPPIPIGPLVFLPVVELDGRISGGVAGQLALDFGFGASFGLGYAYAEGNLDPYTSGPTFTAAPVTTTVTATAELRAELELRLTMSLYGFFGPHAALTAYGGVAIDRFASPCWRLTAGLEGSVGASIGVFGYTLKTIHGPSISIGDPVELASGDCEPLPDPPPTDSLITPWSKSYAETLWSLGTDESFTNLELSHDGRLLVSSATGELVMKVEQNGDVTWARTFEQPARPDSPALEPQHAIPTLDAGILVATEEFVLVKLDQAGALEWATQLDTDNDADGFWAAARVGDEIWLGGEYRPPPSPGSLPEDAWLVGLAPDGSVKWSWTWGGSADDEEAIRHILPLPDGALVVGQVDNFTGVSGRGFVIRINADGTIRWAKHVDDCGTEDLILATALHTRDDNYLVGGWFYATETHGLLFRISPAGTEATPAWATRTHVPGEILGPEIRSLQQLPTGELRVVGRYARPSTNQVFVAGTDSIGRFAWLRNFGGSAGSGGSATSFITDQGGLLVAAGSAALEPSPGGFWLFEVPTPNGTYAFPAASGITMTTLAAQSDPACLTIADAPATTSPMPLPQILVDVRANPATPVVHTQ